MTSNRKIGSFVCASPVDKHGMSPKRSDCCGQRYFRIEIEDPWRIDERWDENDWCPAAAMVSKRRTSHTANFELFERSMLSRRLLVSPQS